MDRNTVHANRIKLFFIIGIIVSLMLAAAGPVTGAPGDRPMSFGDMGADVRQLQQDLGRLEYSLAPVDGVYGFRTRAAVREFQQKRRLKVTGVADRRTTTEIEHLLADRKKEKELQKRGYSRRDIELLARAVHGEARGEPLEGQVAVAAVIVNRVESPRFPKTVKGVIFQSGAFDAVDDGQIWLEPDHKAYKAAEMAILGHDPTGKAIYYYNPDKTTNKWIWSRPVVKKIGRHVFAK
ncbi:MAG: spore cortex-lytic enzyme [Bacillota bacterium]